MKTAILLVITTVLSSCLIYSQETEQPPPEPAQEQPEVLTSGPVHEAFAEPVDLQSQPGIIALTQPPADIEENPPAERPTGQFVWVPGYWAWDSQRNTYIWVSGCWRAIPPKMYWVPGYWSKVPEGWQWVSGFWASMSSVGQIEYLPAPPAIVDVEPSVVATSPDNIWVPPCWYWYKGQYILRRGYWITAKPDWIWEPSHHVWTPRGYVFVAGHWDYALSRRGVLFAPVYFPRRIYERPRFSYSLSIVVDIGNLQFGLFTYPRYCHYYFGDYYDDVYLSIGIFPWFESHSRYTWYDPIYEHHRWRYSRTEPLWEELHRNDYERRRADKNLRPSKTYREMEARLDQMPVIQQKDFWIAAPLKTVIAEKKGQMKFEPMNNNDQQKLSRKTTDVREFGQERSRWESESSGPKATQPSVEKKVPVTPSTKQQQPSARPVERKSKVIAPREAGPNAPERVKTTSPPISDKQDLLSIFRKGPPSRPADEKKTDVREKNSQINSRKNSDTRRDENRRGR